MDTSQIVAKLSKRAEELMESANTRMATLGTVERDDESEGQKAIRIAAQCDFAASGELSRMSDEIARWCEGALSTRVDRNESTSPALTA